MAGASMMFASVCGSFRVLRGPAEFHARCCSLLMRSLGTDDRSRLLPPKPKKPIEPYIAFTTQKMAEIRQSNPGIKSTEVIRTTAQMWKSLMDSEKKEFEPSEGMPAARKRYRDELKEWRSSLTTEQEFEMKMLKKQRQKYISRQRMLKRNKELNKPVMQARSAFALFVKSKPVERGDAPVTMYMKGLAELWQRMAEDDKKKFADQAEANRTDFLTKLNEWEDRMIAEGNLDVVRKFRLPKPPRKKRALKKKKVVAKKKKVAKTKKVAKKKTVSKKTVTKKKVVVKKSVAKAKRPSTKDEADPKKKSKSTEEKTEDVTWMREE